MGIMTFLSKTFRNLINQRLNEDAQYLKAVLDKAVRLPQYQRGFERWSNNQPKTYCNILALDVLDSSSPRKYLGTAIDAFRYDIRIALRGNDLENLLSTPLHESYTRIMQGVAQGRATDVSAREAQAFANSGRPVLVMSAKYDHMAIVYPDPMPWDDLRGPKIAQAGWYNGVFYISDFRSFGKLWGDPEIRYIVLPRWIGE
jgi:hypothetical protein